MTDDPEPGSTAVSPLRSSSHDVPSKVALAPSWCPSSCAEPVQHEAVADRGRAGPSTRRRRYSVPAVDG